MYLEIPNRPQASRIATAINATPSRSRPAFRLWRTDRCICLRLFRHEKLNAAELLESYLVIFQDLQPGGPNPLISGRNSFVDRWIGRTEAVVRLGWMSEHPIRGKVLGGGTRPCGDVRLSVNAEQFVSTLLQVINVAIKLPHEIRLVSPDVLVLSCAFFDFKSEIVNCSNGHILDLFKSRRKLLLLRCVIVKAAFEALREVAVAGIRIVHPPAVCRCDQ